jgi:hypothetical protein
MNEELKAEYERIIKEQKLQNKTLRKLIKEDKKNMQEDEERVNKITVR